MIEESRQGAVKVIGSDDPLIADHLDDAVAAFERCLADCPPMTVFDMRDVPLIDSAGLELLLDTREAFEQRGGALKIAAANALCRDVLTVTGVSDEFEIHNEVLQAVGSFLR